MSQQPASSADRLNALLRAELAAVAAYQHALRLLDGRIGEEFQRLVAFGEGHRQNVAALQACIRALGGLPATEPSVAWSTFTLLRDELSLQQLLEAEERGLAGYEAALPSLGGDVRDLVEQDLIPRQRKHVADLSRLLSDTWSP